MADRQDREPRTVAEVQDELERRLFHLKTLYDVSHEMLGTVEVAKILKNFLLMTTGNFGVVQGILLLREGPYSEMGHRATVGLTEEESALWTETVKGFITDPLTEPENIRVFHGDEAVVPVTCILPFKVDEQCAGVLGLGGKILEGGYSEEDRDLLSTLVNNLIAVLKNARYAEALERAYAEVSSLNRAKDKAINHLSHELKTPMSLLKASLAVLEAKLSRFPEEQWRRPLNRARRNVDRLFEIEYEVEDLMKGEESRAYPVMNLLLDQCAEQLETLAAEQGGGDSLVDAVRSRIEEIFGPRRAAPESIPLSGFVAEKMKELEDRLDGRGVHIVLAPDAGATVTMPRDPLEKVVKGLVRNAVENTPDGGEVRLSVEHRGDGVRLMVQDTGVGIVAADQKRIFEGFYPTQEISDYSSRKPFEFNAGGKGADLLRMKIFSERYHFQMDMASVRCPVVPSATDECPGRIELCEACRSPEDCFQSGGTTFTVLFPENANPPSV